MLLDLWARGLYTKGECFREKKMEKNQRRSSKPGFFERVNTLALQMHPLDLIPHYLHLFYGIFTNI